MRIVHVSAECYPAAKAGGLGDVVGSLPKFQKDAAVIIPKYHTKWILAQEYESVQQGVVRIHHGQVHYDIQRLTSTDLGFEFLVIDIPTKFDRPGIYADSNGNNFGDELERSICFQQAALHYLGSLDEKPEVIHCHDHHTGLIPLLVEYGTDFRSLKGTPTVFTIHNGVYHGAFSWEKYYLLPYLESGAKGLLDWNNTINPLACAIKCAWKVTTVSQSYMEELRTQSNGLEYLLRSEWRKTIGILNGIDAKTWDPKKDPLIKHNLKKSVARYKSQNKKELVTQFGLRKDLPLITFIGRLVREKGADLLPELINYFLAQGKEASFIILGTGDQNLQGRLASMAYHFSPYLNVALEYNESLAHQLYAGSDFIFMPSRVEPCGLNQMFAMRYGTVPIVRKIGGLKDTVPDIGEENGRGINFTHFNVEDAGLALF
ncbi:MAG: glycosyltransferase, partial [Saprospiraceae bacterium]|nr:glycosyltransferase [Saprospiraceae bacterium]